MSAVVERFSREATLLLGGGAAILWQVADPVVAAAVAGRSDFALRPLARLNNTLTFVYATLLGTPRDAEMVAIFTRRAHQRVPGASDPGHQLWVAATLYSVAMKVHERVRGPLNDDDACAVLEAYAALGTALEVPPNAWPATAALFEEYWTRSLAELEVGPQARSVAHDLFHPASAPLRIRAALPLVALLTADLLGARLREAYGMPWTRNRARRAAAAWSIIRFAARVLPDRVLAAPSRHYLARLRAMPSPAA